MVPGSGRSASRQTVFSVVKVRAEQKPGDFKDPGWYRHPPGTTAFEWTGALPEPTRFAAEGGRSMPAAAGPAAPPQAGPDTEVRIRKPGAGSAQHRH